MTILYRGEAASIFSASTGTIITRDGAEMCRHTEAEARAMKVAAE